MNSDAMLPAHSLVRLERSEKKGTGPFRTRDFPGFAAGLRGPVPFFSERSKRSRRDGDRGDYIGRREGMKQKPLHVDRTVVAMCCHSRRVETNNIIRGWCGGSS